MLTLKMNLWATSPNNPMIFKRRIIEMICSQFMLYTKVWSGENMIVSWCSMTSMLLKCIVDYQTYHLSSPLDEGRAFLFLGRLAKKKHLQISVTKNLFITFSIVACAAIGKSGNPLQNRETQHVNIVSRCMYRFSEQEIWKEITFGLNGKPSSVTTFSTDFSFQNLVFWNLFEFSVTKII
jgi:hypothetical protein